MDSDFMSAFAQGLASRGTGLGGLRVVRFEFPYMANARCTGQRRPPDREPVLINSWRSLIADLTRPPQGIIPHSLVIGGKSLGGRIASLIADQLHVAGLVCLGYPFHPPGRPEKTRIDRLKALSTPTLICQGTRDPFGRREEVASYHLSPMISFRWLEEGDHSFKPSKRSAYTYYQHCSSAIEAMLAFIAQVI